MTDSATHPCTDSSQPKKKAGRRVGSKGYSRNLTLAVPGSFPIAPFAAACVVKRRSIRSRSHCMSWSLKSVVRKHWVLVHKTMFGSRTPQGSRVIALLASVI